MAATELGQAYVQIIPSAKGISGKITSAIDPESKSAGKSAGSNIASGIKKAIAAAGIGLALKKTIMEGAELEQSIGGIETLFKGSADTMRKYADEAYKTVGVSANDYMKNVTSFSASLLQSLGGDTDKAAEVANRAMIDMGDNANKMGTNMRDIQNAYQGFAKQNYTMLDNLKLGYGGTKTEMERLLRDAQKLSGVKYDISNLADVYTAVGVIQDQLGITGTTALEAEETITGSLNAMKSAFTNVLGNLAIGEDIKPALKALAKTVSTFLFGNLFPMIGNILSELPSAIMIFIQEAAPQFMESGKTMLMSMLKGIVTGLPTFFEGMVTVMNNLVAWIQEQLPMILKEGVSFISNFATGIFDGMPEVITNMGEILNGILTAVMDFVPTILDAGIDLISNMAQGIWDNMPEIVESISNVLGGLLDTIIENYPEYFKKGWEIIGKIAKGIWDNLPEIIKTMFNLLRELVKKIGEHLPEFLAKGLLMIGQLAIGLVKAIPSLVAKIPEIVVAILGGFGGLVGDFFNIGGDLIRGLWNGINNVKTWLKNKISGWVDNVIGGIKKFFGIKSPSKLMAQEVGKFLPEGLAVGIEGNVKPITDAMNDLGNTTISGFNPDLSVNGKMASSISQPQNNSIFDYNRLAFELKQALVGMQIVLDRKPMGEFVDARIIKGVM